MSHRSYCAVSGALFSLVAVAHLARIVYSVPVTVETYAVPMFASWIAFVVPAILATWAFRLAMRA
ncbi:MAG: hypothetical protein R3288_04945 [Woeseiaceae bacterium]|nr:hypothetical protein [Woeseiaceae bacterium]